MTQTAALSQAMRLNLLTQEQAQQKQCRKAAAVGPSPFGTGLQFTFPACIGAGCGHWRWHVVPDKVQLSGNDPAPAMGCCGLAGDP